MFKLKNIFKYIIDLEFLLFYKPNKLRLHTYSTDYVYV